MKPKNFAVCYNKKISGSAEVKDMLVGLLKQNNIKPKICDIDNLKGVADFVFVIGGDGTILKAARYYAKSGIPVFGVNLGRLGFLSQTSKNRINSSVQKILDGKFIVEERIMLQSGSFSALNDFVIKGCAASRTSRFSLKINGRFVCDYLADGIIISTPTGSTAYGLSAGGPVLAPSLKSFVIVPICPHTLTARPLVIPDGETVTVCAKDFKTKYLVSCDGQEFKEFTKEITIKKSDAAAKLALLDNSDFYAVLQDKLHWGISPVSNH